MKALKVKSWILRPLRRSGIFVTARRDDPSRPHHDGARLQSLDNRGGEPISGGERGGRET
jgi:hypothetical protein